MFCLNMDANDSLTVKTKQQDTCFFLFLKFNIPLLSVLYLVEQYMTFLTILTAVEFLKNTPEGKYDAIIVDSSDPVGT